MAWERLPLAPKERACIHQFMLGAFLHAPRRCDPIMSPAALPLLMLFLVLLLRASAKLR